jgi:hypothetical protein
MSRIGMFRRLRDWRESLQLSRAARGECRRDRRGLPARDPGIEEGIREAMGWLGRAQDRSRLRDGGVARHFSLRTGWGSSYPETTGYIVPTFLAYARERGDEDARGRAQRMLDWLVSIQRTEGAFQGGVIDATPSVPVTFNTGQVLLGLAAGVREFGSGYHKAMTAAADWLVETQDPDGCWRRHPSPFARRGEKVYDTHVAWGLLEAARIEPDRPYARAALANVHWALGHQRANGWFEDCCLTDPRRPLTHTLGYALRGVLEAYEFTGDPALLVASRKTADGLLTALRPDGFLPGRLDADWRGAVSWACLTGSVQTAYCWLILYQRTGEARYREAGYAANRYVRRTMRVAGPEETRGGIKGSFPVDGDYGAYEYLNWAGKFLVDSHLLELRVRRESGHAGEV